jgi:glycosyltransferase involved in cell wall biosynthesis
MANFGPGYPKWEDLLFRTIESRLARGTDAYVVVGTDLARRFELIGVPRRKLHVVRSGITLPTLADREAGRHWLRDRFGVPTDRPIVAYLGSLEWRKSVLDLVPYLSRMLSAPSAPRPYLVVAGEGPLSRPLIAALEAANLMHDAAVVGFVSDPGLVIAAASTLVLLSRAEGVPQVLVQASVLGRPWVAYDVDGARELIELGAPGTLVPLGDVAAAAQATRWIIDSPVPGRLPKFDASPWAPDVIAAAHRHVVEAVFAGRRGLPAETSQYAGTVARAS